jgi:hypothetical protein
VKYDDETLMAYADGELDAKLRAEIAAAINADPALARRVEQQRAMRVRVASAFAKVLDEPLPERLMQAARGKSAPSSAAERGKVIQFPTRTSRPPSAPWRAREWVAMAASLVLGVLLSWRMFAPSDAEVMVAGKDALLARGALADALESQLASEQRGEERVLIGLTFKARDGSFCRSFTLRDSRTAGLACRVDGDWQVPATDSVPASGPMQQASSALPPAILGAVETRVDGVALDAEAERAAQRSGWNPAPP